MTLKFEVEFDNYVDESEEYQTLGMADVVILIPGHGVVIPTSIFSGRHATYELPEGKGLEDLEEALERCLWSHTAITELHDEMCPTP